MTDSSSARALSRLGWALILFVGLGSFITFYGVVTADFVRWDDDTNIYRNPHLKGLSSASLQWAFTDVEYVWRYMPLGWLGWLVNYDLDSLNPATYHWGNLLFHCLNSVLVFLLVRKLLLLGGFGGVGSAKQNYLLICSAVGALVWALHPLRVEPVAWASGRIYCQALFFLLISLLCYLRCCTGSQPRWKGIYYWLSVATYAASLLTYPIALGFVFVLVILDVYPLRRFHGGPSGWWDAAARRIWIEKTPFLAVVGLVFALTLWARLQATGLWARPASLEQFGLFPRVMQGFYIWAYYVWRTWVPTDLSPLYTALISFNPNALVFQLSLALVLSISVWLFIRRQRWPAAFALWLCHLILLLPVLGLTEHPHYASDRYSYLVGIIWAVLIPLCFLRYSQEAKHRRLALMGGTLAVGVLGSMSFQQVSVWKNSETLFTHMIQKLGDDPYRYEIWLRLGYVYTEAGNYGAAAESFQQVLEINPNQLEAQFHLGNALALQGKLEKAVRVYTRLIQIAPNYRDAHLNLGNAYGDLGKRKEAGTNFLAALSSSPDDPSARLAYGQLLVEEGQLEEGIRQYLEAKRLDPSREIVYLKLAKAYTQQGKIQEAIAASRHALRMKPDWTGALVELAWILSTTEEGILRNPAEARQCALRANELTGNKHPKVLDALAAAYAEAGEFDDAAQTARRAIELTESSEAKRAIQERLELYLARQPYREVSTRNRTNP